MFGRIIIEWHLVHWYSFYFILFYFILFYFIWFDLILLDSIIFVLCICVKWNFISMNINMTPTIFHLLLFGWQVLFSQDECDVSSVQLFNAVVHRINYITHCCQLVTAFWLDLTIVKAQTLKHSTCSKFNWLQSMTTAWVL